MKIGFIYLKILKALPSACLSMPQLPQPQPKAVELIWEWKKEKFIFKENKTKQTTNTPKNPQPKPTQSPQPWKINLLTVKMKLITIGLATSPYMKDPELEGGASKILHHAGHGGSWVRLSCFQPPSFQPSPKSSQLRKGKLSRTNPSPASGWPPLKSCRNPQGTLLPH